LRNQQALSTNRNCLITVITQAVFVHAALQGEYAARIHNLRSFDAVSRDLLARWAFPFVPDTNVFYRAGAWGPSSYRYARGHK
jgi:translation initiation factor eIF-2B subunit epsilon